MPYITVGEENGANIDMYYKDWGKGQPIVSAMVGLSRRMIGTRRCFFSSAKAIVLLPLIGVDMVARLKPAADTTWIIMPMI